MKLSQVRLLVGDPAAAFRFDRDVLELEPTFGVEGEAYTSFMTMTDSMWLEIMRGREGG